MAITSLVEYYHRKDIKDGRISEIKNSRGKIDVTGAIGVWKYEFIRILEMAITIGAYDNKDPEGGTFDSKMPKIVTKYYDYYDKNMKGNRDIFSVNSTINKNNKKARPVIGNLTAPNGEGHSVVIAGYYDITVKYKKKATDKKYKTETYRYYAINNGWYTSYEGSDRIQYVRKEYVDTIVKIK